MHEWVCQLVVQVKTCLVSEITLTTQSSVQPRVMIMVNIMSQIADGGIDRLPQEPKERMGPQSESPMRFLAQRSEGRNS